MELVQILFKFVVKFKFFCCYFKIFPPRPESAFNLRIQIQERK